MELQYGHTMRLHHLDFPEPSQAIDNWEQTNPKNQLEVKTPATTANKSLSSSKVSGRFLAAAASRQEQALPQGAGMNAANTKPTRQGCQGVTPGTKNVKKTAKSESIQTNFSRRISMKHYGSGQPMVSAVSIEWDVLDSFQEFATFLELQNPICPAELLDTPEKLMSVLSWDA